MIHPLHSPPPFSFNRFKTSLQEMLVSNHDAMRQTKSYRQFARESRDLPVLVHRTPNAD